LTVICLFLPLSAIWAGVIANDPGIASNGADAHQHLLKGQFGRSTLEVSNFKGSTIASSLGTSPESPTSYKHGSVDDGHIHVNREWAIDNDKAEASNSYGEV
jgi:pheromone alpha factor receptor